MERQSFTLRAYETLLFGLIGNGYLFVNSEQAQIFQKPFVVLRHDVDLDPEKAIALAQIENGLHIKSTYCFLVSSDLYNPLSVKGQKVIEKLKSLGHEIALHFNIGNYPLEKRKDGLNKERWTLSRIVGLPIRAMSTHCPVANGDIDCPSELINMRDIDAAYFADSYGCWRYGHPLDSEAFKEKKSLQICVHPEWWNGEYVSPLRTIHKYEMQRRETFILTVAKELVGL